MLRHIVMMRFADRKRLKESTSSTKNILENLSSSIESLRSIEVGVNISDRPTAYDLVLTADFDDAEGLDAYRVHPDHVEALKHIKAVVEKTAVVDYYC